MHKHRVTIRKKVETRSLFAQQTAALGLVRNTPKMWIGECVCEWATQYWDFGATLGASQEHQRRAAANG